MDTEERKEAESRRGYWIGGITLIGLGCFFLASQMGWIPYVRESWPVILIIVGIAVMTGAFTGKPKKNPHPPD